MAIRYLLLPLFLLIWVTNGSARSRIQIVGSSTVFPFSAAVAETFGKTTRYKTPVVEATGSGGGIKLFCAGIGENTPDITNASRKMKRKEFLKCVSNGVTPVEVKIGFDGIVLANSRHGDPIFLTLQQVFLALAKRVPDAQGKLIANPYLLWSDIDASLPAEKIEILGPPPTSGTRDAFEELAMGGGAKSIAILKELKGLTKGDKRIEEIAVSLGLESHEYFYEGQTLKGKSIFKRIAREIREDGAYIEAGENDNLIIQKLQHNPTAIGIFGFSFLDQNSDKVQGAAINGVSPQFEKIASGAYKISRSIFFYIKKEHVGIIPGIDQYVQEFLKEGTWGDEGYLAEKGLIPLDKSVRKSVAVSAKSLAPLALPSTEKH